MIIAVFLIALDQLSKIWVANTYPLGGPGEPIGLGFHVTHVRNTGAAFGIFQEGTLALGILSAMVATGILVYLFVKRRELSLLQRSALILVFSGAVGNMIDRFAYGYVIDFIHFQVQGFSFPVFNVADTCVVVGAGLLILSSFLPSRQHAARGQENADGDLSKQPD